MRMEKKIKIRLFLLMIGIVIVTGYFIFSNIPDDYLQLAKETGNYSYCDKLPDENDCTPATEHCLMSCLSQIQRCKVDFTPIEKCYLTLIKQDPNVEVCERISQGKYYMSSHGPRQTLKDQCFYVVSVETNNSSLCYKIENNYPKITCLLQFNISNENSPQ